MPFCEPCARHWTPSSMAEDGSCPGCGRILATSALATAAAATAATKQQPAARAAPKAPWHFKVLLASLAVYLGYRAFQGVEWLAHRL